MNRIQKELIKEIDTIVEAHPLKIRHRPDHAVLDENGRAAPIEVYENGRLNQKKLIEWAMFFEQSAQRRTQRDHIGPYTVSTIFLGLNHQYDPGKPPLWFETIVFGPPRAEIEIRPELWLRRTTTKAQAEKAHARGLKWLHAYLGRRRTGS